MRPPLVFSIPLKALTCPLSTSYIPSTTTTPAALTASTQFFAAKNPEKASCNALEPAASD